MPSHNEFLNEIPLSASFSMNELKLKISRFQSLMMQLELHLEIHKPFSFNKQNIDSSESPALVHFYMI